MALAGIQKAECTVVPPNSKLKVIYAEMSYVKDVYVAALPVVAMARQYFLVL